MRTPRVTLLLAASLLIAAELVSVSILLKGIADLRVESRASALARAAQLAPQISGWARSQEAAPGKTLAPAWIEPFERLTIEEPATLGLTDQDRRRLDEGELIVISPTEETAVSVVGSVPIDSGRVVFRLTDKSFDPSRVATDQILIAQHSLILLCALTAFALAAFARAAPERDAGMPTLRAYEEAMFRLRLRDDERLAAFDREKLRLTSVLRDREAMARAGELTAGIVHEVRNSMGVIATRARAIEQSGEEQVQSAAKAIAEEVRTLQTVMSRFVDFIRTEKVQDIDFDLSRMVARVVSRERANHGARIDVDGVETLVRGDEDLLERAVENVVRNACQAAGDSGSVTVKFGADATHAFVIVEDTGPGFRDVDRALRPFESARPGGLGLGLPLVLKILTLHQGTLDLGPRQGGEGTQAVCRWPLATRSATSSSEESKRVASGAGT